MKRYVTGLMIVAVLFAGTATLSAPRSVDAANLDTITGETRQQLISLLQEIISRILADKGSDAMMEKDDGAMMKKAEGAYTLTLDTDLAALDEGYYEGWLIVGDEKISTGLFNEGGEQTFYFDTPIKDIDKVVVTIEPEDDPDAGPSGIIVLAGEVSDGDVALAFPIDFSDAAGTAILATPTNGSDTDETSGIWFLDLPDPSVSLELQELPTGWVYEGWAVHDGTPLTSGRFTDATAADDFDGYSGPQDAPPFPGEDFLENAPAGIDFPIDLADGNSKIVLSVEPDIDGVDPTGVGPAQVKPLVAEIAKKQADHANITLDLNLDSVPSGSATLR